MVIYTMPISASSAEPVKFKTRPSNMQSSRTNYYPFKTTKLFYKLCLICYYGGMPNFWMEPLPFPKKIDAPHRICSRIITVLVYVFILSEFAAVFTQKNITEKQASNQIIFIMSHPMLWSYSVSFCRQVKKVRKILVDIMKLKEVYSDVQIEKRMMKKSMFYSTAFCGMCVVSMMMYTFDAIMQVIKKDGTFTTIINAWPMVDDTSAAANVSRVVWNVLWWAMMARVLIVYAFVISLTSCMSHQFINLQSYFYSLDLIFSKSKFSQRRKELQYEAAYKIGIKLHSDTLKCVELSKGICGWVFSGQIIFNVAMLVILMAQLLTAERSLMRVGAIATSAFCIVMATGLFMCIAGDVTVESSELSQAMYSSGWDNCQGPCSVRVRKLLMTSMIFAQRPVVIKGLGILSLSYESYVSLIKSTYSVFSLVFQHTQ